MWFSADTFINQDHSIDHAYYCITMLWASEHGRGQPIDVGKK